jgi:hypothetical protein
MTRPTTRCNDCGSPVNQVPCGAMLHDATWRKIARDAEFLCGQCLLHRAALRNVSISFADLLPCPLNLEGSPRSWFEVLLERETTQPGLSEWRDVIDNDGIDWRAEAFLGGPVPSVLRDLDAPSCSPRHAGNLTGSAEASKGPAPYHRATPQKIAV